MLNLKICDDVEIIQGVLTIHSTQLPTYRLVRELPHGANGLVFEGSHERDGRCVVKIWLRDGVNWQKRFSRGFEEVRHTAQASSHWSVEMIDAQLVSGVFVASMKWVEGETLRYMLSENFDDTRRWLLAKAYMDAIFATHYTPHGDAHPGNVMVETRDVSNAVEFKAVLIDFASNEVGSRSRERRHWDVFRQTLCLIVTKLPKFSDAAQDLLHETNVVEDDYREMLERLKP